MKPMRVLAGGLVATAVAAVLTKGAAQAPRASATADAARDAAALPSCVLESDAGTVAFASCRVFQETAHDAGVPRLRIEGREPGSSFEVSVVVVDTPRVWTLPQGSYDVRATVWMHPCAWLARKDGSRSVGGPTRLTLTTATLATEAGLDRYEMHGELEIGMNPVPNKCLNKTLRIVF